MKRSRICFAHISSNALKWKSLQKQFRGRTPKSNISFLERCLKNLKRFKNSRTEINISCFFVATLLWILLRVFRLPGRSRSKEFLVELSHEFHTIFLFFLKIIIPKKVILKMKLLINAIIYKLYFSLIQLN